jgi:hypothetical protein
VQTPDEVREKRSQRKEEIKQKKVIRAERFQQKDRQGNTVRGRGFIRYNPDEIVGEKEEPKVWDRCVRSVRL